MRVLERLNSGPRYFFGRPLVANMCRLDARLTNARRTRLAMAAAAMLAMLLGACSEHHWSAYRLSEEMYFNAQHTIADSVEARKAHRVCHQAAPITGASTASDTRPGVTQDALISFCGSNSSRTTAYQGSLANGYERWVQDEMPELPNVNETAASAGDD